MSYKQFVKGAPRKEAFQKRVNCKVNITAKTNKEQAIKRLPSPVSGEDVPDYCVYFHARERNGKRVMSYTQSISGSVFGEVLTLWILDNHSRLGYHPVAMAKAILKATKDSWYKATGERVE